jgi:threonine aldolase
MERGNFNSDNETGTAAEILAAIARANAGMAHSYGEDALTGRVRDRLRAVFEAPQMEVFPVVTGTAANALALAQVTPPYGAVYCHVEAHINTDECGAPELYSGGAKLIGLPGERAKIDPGVLARTLAYTGELGDHECLPSTLSLSQATEHGAVYTPAEVAELAAIAKRHGLRVHMDGARFANALVHAGCTPAELTWRAGVDLLSFGATKNGAMMAEALLVFDPALAGGLGRRRKRAGHLVSKMRFVSAQLDAYLEDDLWLRLARHANATARALADGLRRIPNVEVLYPVEANEVFVRMPADLVKGLREAGFEFHPWPRTDDVHRLVTAFDTPPEAVDALVRTAAALVR